MNISRLALVTAGVAIVFWSAPGVTTASDTSGAKAAVNRALAAVNQGNLKASVAACDSPAESTDAFPPNAWEGSTACADWAIAYAAYNKKNEITGGVVTLGTNRQKRS